MLEYNPVAWLEGRDVLQERLLWGLCLAAVIFLAAKHLLTRSSWPNEDWVITWGMCSQYTLCLWLGIQAPRRLAEDKDSGALELLLCTPTSPQEVVRGNLLALRRRFGRAMLLLVCLDAFLVHAYRAQHGGWSGLSYNGWDNFLTVALYGLIVFPIQGWSIARVGVYEGLVHAGRGSFFCPGKAGAVAVGFIYYLPICVGRAGASVQVSRGERFYGLWDVGPGAPGVLPGVCAPCQLAFAAQFARSGCGSPPKAVVEILAQANAGQVKDCFFAL